MQTFIFISLFILTPIVMVCLLKIAGERTNQISLITAVIYSIYIFAILGTFPLYFMLDEYRVEIGVVKKEVVLLILINTFFCIVFFLCGVIFLRKVLGFYSTPICSHEIKKLSKIREIAIALVIAFVFGVLILYMKKIDSIALFEALNGSIVDAAKTRSDMGNNLLGGGAHWYSLILNNVALLFTIIIFASWLIKKNIFLSFLLIISISLSSFIAVMSIEKAPFINLLISLLVTYYLVRCNGIVPLKILINFGFISFFILILFYMLFMGAVTVEDAFANIISRLFSGSITPAYFYLEYYPSFSDFLLGQTFPNPGGVMPYVPVRFTIEVMNWVFPELASSEVVGTMPTVFWGEAYVNFGWFGVPVVSFLMGILISFMSYAVLRLELNSITIGLYVWMIDHYKKLSQTGFSGYLYDFYFFGVALFILLTLLFAGLFGVNKKSIS